MRWFFFKHSRNHTIPEIKWIAILVLSYIVNCIDCSFKWGKKHAFNRKWLLYLFYLLQAIFHVQILTVNSRLIDWTYSSVTMYVPCSLLYKKVQHNESFLHVSFRQILFICCRSSCSGHLLLVDRKFCPWQDSLIGCKCPWGLQGFQILENVFRLFFSLVADVVDFTLFLTEWMRRNCKGILIDPENKLGHHRFWALQIVQS